MAKFYDVDQNTEDWMFLRRGNITASNFGTIMANYGKAFGEPAKKYAMRVALEGKTQKSIETYKNGYMERGNELEPLARELYEMETMQTVKLGGFMLEGRFGGSADGIVNPKGINEIKSVIYSTHFERWEKGGYDTSYQWQIQGNIWLYDADWCDFISYCPEFPSQKQLYIYRVARDSEAIIKLRTRLDEFKLVVEKYEAILN